MSDKPSNRQDPVESTPGHASASYGAPRFDAVGLFVQWLSEALAKVVPSFTVDIAVGLSYEPAVYLAAYTPEASKFTARWGINELNGALELHNGRGDGLRHMIAETMRELREQIKEDQNADHDC